MFKTIIKKLKEWYRRRFCNVAIDYSNGTDYTAETRYSIDKQGNIKIYSGNLIAPHGNNGAMGIIAARSNGKSGFWIKIFESRYIQITNPRVWHLAHYAKKNRTRKKNISRLEKIRRRIYE